MFNFVFVFVLLLLGGLNLAFASGLSGIEHRRNIEKKLIN